MATGKWQHDKYRGSRQQRGYGAAWEKLRLLVLQRDCFVCQCEECKREDRTTSATEVDHIVPKAQGGTDDMTNLRAVSAACHKRITAQQRGYRWHEMPDPTGWADEPTRGGGANEN